MEHHTSFWFRQPIFYPKPNPMAEVRDHIPNQNDVSLSLASHVIATHARDKNLVLSPLSINVVLGMIASGSSGPTRDQMLGFLKSESVEELNSLSAKLVAHLFTDGGPLGGPSLSAANGVWIDQRLRFKPAFGEIIRNSYKAASNHADFQYKAEEVRKEVNAWAENETNGLVKEILEPGSVNDLTQLIFANAIYFKGAWLHELEAIRTKEADFFLSNGSSIKSPFMTSTLKKRQCIREFDGFKVLGLPYKQGEDRNRKFSMYFFLPDARDGLPALLERVGSESRFIENHVPHEAVLVGRFLIPKFKIGFDFEASKVLKGLGVVLPFRMGGLTEMIDFGGEFLEVSKIFHKSFIEVNERGTEAAAATVALMGFGCSRVIEKTVDFVADHPFLFVVREDISGAVLFIGQLLNPLAE
ncbi:hypothetical protein ABFX02_03G049200 [Erythranthe guttata]